MTNRIRIAVYSHFSPDYMGRKAVFHTLEPVEACSRKYASPIAGFGPSPINYSHGPSQLVGYIIAPPGTEAFTDTHGYCQIKTRADIIGLSLAGAVRLAKNQMHGLSWEAATVP